MTTLEMIVDRNIRARHVLVCGKVDARRAIKSLRDARARRAEEAHDKNAKFVGMVADGFGEQFAHYTNVSL